MRDNIMNNVLFRLRDTDKENDFIDAFFTERPEHFLQMFNYMKEAGIPLHRAGFKDDSNDIVGCVEDIDVYFADEEHLPCVDIWIEVWR